MPNKCSVYNCRSNYSKNKENYCTVYWLPVNEEQRQHWINSISYFDLSNCEPSNFRVCKKHWNKNAPTVTVKGKCRPAGPPSLFDILKSSIPTPKLPPRKAKKEFASQQYFDENDKFNSFTSFSPQRELSKKYDNVLTKQCSNKTVFVFMSSNCTNADFVV